MRHQFTPAANRALSAAANWASGDSGGSLAPVELLLGLLDEAESRAAEMLAARGIDTATVLARWPQKGQSPKSKVQSQKDPDQGGAVLSAELQDALAGVSYRLTDLPRPLELATEHLLLGLVAAHDELAEWLAERGFDADSLTHEICHLYGYRGNGDSVGKALSGVSEEGSGFRVQGSGKEKPEPDSVENAVCGVPEEGSGFRLRGSGDEPPQLDSVGNALCGVPPPTGGVPVAEQRNATQRVPNRTESTLLRLLDAAANRAREGLRVLEDYVRFVANDRYLTSQLKQLRHDLAAALGQLSAADLLASRDTLADVGTELTTEAERDRSDTTSVVTANAKRLQESLRSLEEYGKIFSPQMSAQIEQLRYRSYTLERAMAATSFGMLRLARARLYVLIDGRATSGDFEQIVKQLVVAGVHVVQLRDKQLSDRDLLARAIELRELTAGSETLFVMNDRPDLAVLARADGVHVGQEELSVAACRALVGPRMLVGVSTHSLAQARQAVLDGANYLGVGPTFVSRTKRFDEHSLRGPELLRAVQAELSLPIFAIGGIVLGNLPDVLATGVTRVAVSGAILSSEDAGQAARSILARLGTAARF